MKGIASLFLLVLLSGCVIAPVPRMAFPAEEYLSLATSGTAIVKGQAFLKTRGGDVKFAAGNEVFLNPVTSYSEEWYDKSYIPRKLISYSDPRLQDYVRTTVADGSGRFTFKNVPAGKYFVTSSVFWEAATGYQGALRVQGSYMTKRISVNEGDEIEVVVTRSD